MHLSHITRAFALTAAAAMAACPAHAAGTEDVATETTPVTPAAAPAESKPLAETLDPTVDAPLPTDLPAEKTPPPAAPSTNVTVNLINLLVQKGHLTQAEAAEMIKQAETEAATAAAREDVAALPPEPSPEEETRITYIPEVVKNQMRDQIQQELMAQAREEKWSEKQYPEWTSKFKPFGDIRVRSENVMFPEGNANEGQFPDFNRINTGNPYDVSYSNPNFAPQRNVDQNRHRTRLRARVGTEILLGEGFNGGIRLATGSDNSPTSTNQTLSGFSKYSVWLDRAFLSYDAGPGDGEELKFFVGRFDNPFFSTEIQWDDDLGFDGLALRGKVRINDCASTFFTAGYFPVYNTDFSFASNQPAKFESTDKWLAGAQIGIEWNFAEDTTAKVAVAYYDFQDIAGELSSPFIPLSTSDAGDTDTTRPAFAQSGNTYIALRDIDNSTEANDFGNKYQYQYFGLASEFQNLAFTGRLDYDHFEPVRLSLVGEYIRNLAFDVNTDTAIGNRGDDDIYEGGDSAWYLAFIVGNPALEKLWDWQASIGYRYVESDAVVDGFTDSDFGGGGTNVQGFTLGGSVAITKEVRCGLRWLSSDEIAGPPLSQDTLQIDLNAKF